MNMRRRGGKGTTFRSLGSPHHSRKWQKVHEPGPKVEPSHSPLSINALPEIVRVILSPNLTEEMEGRGGRGEKTNRVLEGRREWVSTSVREGPREYLYR